MAFGDLRSLLHEPPSPGLWNRLLTWIEENPGALADSAESAYLHHSLERWPDALRVLPRRMLGYALVGQERDVFPLCRALDVRGWTDPEPKDRDEIWGHGDLEVGEMWEMTLDGPHLGYLDYLLAHPQLDQVTVVNMRANAVRWGDWYHVERAADLGATGIMPSHLEGLSSLDLVREVLLGGSEVKELLLRTLERVAPGLERLELGHTLAFEASSWIPTFPNLQHLHSRYTPITTERLAAWLASDGLSTLRSVELLVYDVSNASIRECRLPPALESLDLSDARFLSKGWSWLMSVEMPTTMRHLRLRRSGLTQERLAQLRQAPWFSQLESLDISANEATLGDHAPLDPRPPELRLTMTQDPGVPGVLVAPPEIKDLTCPAPEEAWWAWRYACDAFAGEPIREWWAERPEWSRGPLDGVPRVYLSKYGDPAHELREAPEPVGGKIACGTSRKALEMCRAFAQRYKSHKHTLKMLTWHDVSDEEEQPSWIQGSDVTELLHAFPALEFFGVKGGLFLRLEGLRHQGLRALTLITGGMPHVLLEDLEGAHLPALEALELWLGDPEYGCTVTVERLKPILENRASSGAKLFPKLRQLGLCNTWLGDEIVAALVESSCLSELETLDLRYSMLTDEGLRLLMESPATWSLKRLLLNVNLLRDRAPADALASAGVQVSWGHQTYASGYDSYLEVAE